MWISQVPLPLAFGAPLSQQYIVVPQVGGGACFGFAPGSSAQGVVAVGDVLLWPFEFDELAFGVEGAVFGGVAGNADFRAQGIIGSFIVTTSDQAILFNLAAFRESVAAQVVVVLGVVFLDQLALAGLGQDPASRVSLCALRPESRVFPVGDVPGGVVLKVDVTAIWGAQRSIWPAAFQPSCHCWPSARVMAVRRSLRSYW